MVLGALYRPMVVVSSTGTVVRPMSNVAASKLCHWMTPESRGCHLSRGRAMSCRAGMASLNAVRAAQASKRRGSHCGFRGRQVRSAEHLISDVGFGGYLEPFIYIARRTGKLRPLVLHTIGVPLFGASQQVRVSLRFRKLGRRICSVKEYSSLVQQRYRLPPGFPALECSGCFSDRPRRPRCPEFATRGSGVRVPQLHRHNRRSKALSRSGKRVFVVFGGQVQKLLIE
jgi:hypothetical protein